MAAAFGPRLMEIRTGGRRSAHSARRFSALDATLCYPVVPTEDVELFATGIGGELRAQFEKVHKSAWPTTLTSIGTIDKSAEFADVREHLGNCPLLRHTNGLVDGKQWNCRKSSCACRSDAGTRRQGNFVLVTDTVIR